MNLRKTAIAIIIVICSLNSYSQADSLLNALVSANETSKASIYNELAHLYMDSTGSAGINFSLNAIKYANQNSQLGAETFGYIMLGSCHLFKSNYQLALNAFLKAEELAIKIDDYCNLQMIYANIGIVNRYSGKIELSIEYNSKALNNALECGDLAGIIQTYISIGNSYALQEDYKKSLSYFHQGVEKIESLDTLPSSLAGLYNNIGYIYYMMEDYNMAEESYYNAFIIFDRIKNYYGMAICLNNIAEIKILFNQYSEAEKYIYKADSLHTLNDFKETRKNLYFTTHQLYYKSGDFERSLYYLNKYQILKDSIYTENLDIELNKLETKYAIDKLTLEGVNQDLKIEQQSKLNKILIIVISAIMFLLAFSIYLMFQKTKLNKKLKSKNKLLKLKDEEIRDNLNYARKIQVSSMNNTHDQYDLGYFIFDKPKNTVGGDFYLTKKKDKKSYFILGDTTGHGVSGGFLSVISIEFLNAILEQYSQPKQILKYLNNKFFDYLIKSNDLKGESLAISIICVNENTITYAGSKHKIWLFVKEENSLLEFKTNMEIIGLNNNIDFHEGTFNVKKGDMLYLSSDGFPDQFGSNNKGKYKYSRFRESLKDCNSIPLKDIPQKLEDNLEEWKNGEEQTDDILVLGIKI